MKYFFENRCKPLNFENIDCVIFNASYKAQKIPIILLFTFFFWATKLYRS